MEGNKHDSEKLRWDLLPIEVVEEVVDVLTKGAKKYSPDNWKYVEPYKERYYSAAMRHIALWRKGEILDPESGLHHLSHAICCFLFIIWKDRNKEHK